MTKVNVRTRIAPSPTGSPHIGTAYSALFNYCFAKKNNGQFILRIEDTDRTRFVEGSEKEIIEALSWLGLPQDENPKKGGQYGPYRQSERLAIYKKNIESLLESKSAYLCDCSPERLTSIREEQQSRKELPHYDRKCRFEEGKDPSKSVVRLAVPEDGVTVVDDLIRGKVEFQNKLIDDQVLLKSDGFPTYHLASVVDDHLMEISHVIRAEEWLSSTPKHVLLYKAFGWEIPKFAHLALLRNQDKSKISKRKNPVSVDYYRQEGYLPEAFVNFLGLMGWSMPNDQEIFSLDEMVENFTFERVDVAGPIFDIQKLNWLNGEYIRAKADKDLAEILVAEKFTKLNQERILDLLPLVKERMKQLTEFDQLTSFFVEDIEIKKEIYLPKEKTEVETLEILKHLVNKVEDIPWEEKDLEETIGLFQETTSWSRKELFMCLRLIVSASPTTPPLFQTLEKLGRDKALARIKKAIEQL